MQQVGDQRSRKVSLLGIAVKGLQVVKLFLFGHVFLVLCRQLGAKDLGEVSLHVTPVHVTNCVAFFLQESIKLVQLLNCKAGKEPFWLVKFSEFFRIFFVFFESIYKVLNKLFKESVTAQFPELSHPFLILSVLSDPLSMCKHVFWLDLRPVEVIFEPTDLLAVNLLVVFVVLKASFEPCFLAE
jgi:hypothetical protein